MCKKLTQEPRETIESDPQKLLLGDMCDDFQIQLILEKDASNKRKCDACFVTTEETKIQACSGCIGRTGQPAYYCSRECQRDAWKTHKLYCGRDLLSPFMFTKHPTLKTCRKASRLMEKKMEGVHMILSWASLMIAGSCPSVCDDEVVVRFVFKELTTPSDPWVLDQVELIPIDWTTGEMANLAKVIGVTSLYQISFGPYDLQPFPCHKDFACFCCQSTQYAPLTPLWPWLVAHVCLYGGTDSWVAFHRLERLRGVLEGGCPCCPFQKWQNTFKAPTNLAQFPWRLPRLNKWLAKMKDVMEF